VSAIPDDVIEQVRDAADLVGIIGEFVDLRRTGADYRGRCPFHGGTHRNFAVIPKKQMFYCFVCHEGGDVFTFFMKRLGLEYPQAVREVAGKVGIVIPERTTGGPDPAEPLFTAVSVAADWYARRLRESPDAAAARDYLRDRGFDLDALAPFGLGWAPKGDAFIDAMGTLGIPPATLLEAGLAVQREDGSIRPKFWARLLFAIHDLRGRVVGFGGRTLGDAEPKYLNSPDSQVFHKGRLLYNLHQAKHAIRKAGRAIVVEGYFDVLRVIEAGFDNVVAPLGTGFSAEQAALLKRYAPETVLLYDSDKAGMKAAFRASDRLLEASVRPLVATPPPGEDPDTLVRNRGAEALRSVLDDALDVFEGKLMLIERKGWLGTLHGRRNALDRLLPTIRAAHDPITRDLYIGRAAEALGISTESVRREALSGERSVRRPVPSQPSPTEPYVHRMRPDRDLVSVMLHEPSWRSRIAEQVPDATRLMQPEREIFERLRDAPEITVADLLPTVSGSAQRLLEDLMAGEWGALELGEIVAGAVNRIDSRPLESQLRELQRQHDLVADADKATIQREIVSLREKITKLNPARWPVIR